MNQETITQNNKLNKKLDKIEKELEKCRAKEYDLPFGSSQRAKASLNWDYWAKEKMKVLSQMDQ